MLWGGEKIEGAEMKVSLKKGGGKSRQDLKKPESATRKQEVVSKRKARGGGDCREQPRGQGPPKKLQRGQKQGRPELKKS